jgi:hypothetical protein
MGSYSNLGGSEEYIQLNLKSDNRYVLKHETWAPGAYENRGKSEFHGLYSCDGNSLVLTGNNISNQANLEKVGINPLGIDRNTEILKFDESSDLENKFLSNEILYPDIE